MDGSRFDAATRALQTATPRRAALALLLGGALGCAELAESAARKKRGKKGGKKGGGKNGGGKKTCGSGQKPCGAKCILQSDCCTDNDCNRCAREICQDGVCGCHPDLIRHNGVCGFYNGCKSAGLIVQSSFECCSDESIIDADSGQERCLPGKFECVVPLDCEGGGQCRGFMCPELYNATVGGGC